MSDTINRQEAINAVLRNLNEEKYRSSWESGAVKVMKDTLEKMPTEDNSVNGVLFKGRSEEGNYNLIKTTDGWVLKGETSYAGFNEDTPTIEPKRGEWIKSSAVDIAWGEKVYTCSNCGRKQDWKNNFCPNCGAKMVAKDTNAPNMKGEDDE